MKTCSQPYCRRPHKAKGYCTLHYNRWAKMGRRREAFRRIPKAKGKTFDLKSLGAVGWRVRP